MRTIIIIAVALIALSPAAVFAKGPNSCSANRAVCETAAKKHGWTQPQCADAFSRCMASGTWQTTGEHGRTVSNVDRR